MLADIAVHRSGAYLLYEIPGFSLLPCTFKRIHFGLTTYEINVLKLVDPGTLKQLPEQVESRENWQADIRNDEVTCVPLAFHEHGEAIEEANDAEENHRGPRDVRLEADSKPDVLILQALHNLCFAKANIGIAYCDPCQEAGDRSQVGELHGHVN